MTKLGIIGAMDMEVETLRQHMENLTVSRHAGCDYCEGTLRGLPVVVVQSGVGKVNAAICTQILCSQFGITHLVNTGVAGSLCAELDISDLVVSRDAIHHDVDCQIFGYAPCQVPGMALTAFPADETLIRCAYAAAEAVNPGHTHIGRVASGDRFIADDGQKKQILSVTQALCTEMEGAAIAQTAYRNGIPYVILRAISDKADHTVEVEYPVFEQAAAHHCAQITLHMVSQLRALG